MGQLSQGSGLSGNTVCVTAALFAEKCALSHGSGVLGRDARNSCRFWSPHVEKSVHSHTVSAWGG